MPRETPQPEPADEPSIDEVMRQEHPEAFTPEARAAAADELITAAERRLAKWVSGELELSDIESPIAVLGTTITFVEKVQGEGVDLSEDVERRLTTLRETRDGLIAKRGGLGLQNMVRFQLSRAGCSSRAAEEPFEFGCLLLQITGSSAEHRVQIVSR